MMSKAVLASFMESEQRTVLVENSTEDASADLFLLSMETLANEFASVLTNHVMPKYIKDNFKNGDRFPEFKPGPLSDSARKRIASLFEKLVVSGILNSTPELVRELEKHIARDLGLDVDYEEIEAREEEAAIQQAQQAEMMAAQAQQETIEAERAAEGGIPSADTNTGNARTLTTRTSSGERGQVPAEANSGVSLSYDRDLDRLMEAAQNLFMPDKIAPEVYAPNNYAVDEGFAN